jgi:4-amino-4-deoxy-L-arabinose transferase-like glycosyltransferase
VTTVTVAPADASGSTIPAPAEAAETAITLPAEAAEAAPHEAPEVTDAPVTAGRPTKAAQANGSVLTAPAIAVPRLTAASPDILVVLPAPHTRLARLSQLRSRVVAFVLPRWPLFLVLTVVTVLASHLIMSNTAFADEATYLDAGHIQWQNWFHGGQHIGYSTYFSGSPEIYPLLAAGANAIGGLALARSLSLLCMLATIAFQYGTANRLFGRRAAGWAVAIFATVDGTQFLAAFATYDAMALMLLTASVWVSVRFVQSNRLRPHAGLLLGVPILALANATKYATGLYDPIVVIVIGLVVAERYGKRQGIRMAVMFAAMLGAVLCAAVSVAGSAYAHGIFATTLNRAAGDSTVPQVLEQAVRWVGALGALSLLAVIVALASWWRSRRIGAVTGRRDPKAWLRLALVSVLGFTVALAPIQQAHIHTTVSLHKHVTFGAWFAAIAVGALLSRISGARLTSFWRWVPITALVGGLMAVGVSQASASYRAWPNVTPFVNSIQPYMDATINKPVLMDDADVGKYYLGSGLPPSHWVSTYFLVYQPPGSDKLLSGEDAYLSAIKHNHFGVIALSPGGVTNWLDQEIEQAIADNPHYRYIGSVDMSASGGHSSYDIWMDQQPETTS